MFKLCVFLFCVSLAFSETVKTVSEENYFTETESIEAKMYGVPDAGGVSLMENDGDGLMENGSGIRMEEMDDGYGSGGLFDGFASFSTTVATTIVSQTTVSTTPVFTTTTPTPTIALEKNLDINSKIFLFLIFYETIRTA